MQLDPDDTVGFDHVLALAESSEPLSYSEGLFRLSELTMHRPRAAARLWRMFQSVNSDSQKAGMILDALIGLQSTRPDLIREVRARMNDKRHSGGPHQLRMAWSLLRLDSDSEEGWEVFRSFLFQSVERSGRLGKILNEKVGSVTTAMMHLGSLPIDASRKKALLREVVAYYSAPSIQQEHLRRTALKSLIQLDPSELRRDFAESARLFLE
jgi:hypothetical protein